MDFKKVLKEIRRKKEWNQEQLGAELGFTDRRQQRVSDLENTGAGIEEHWRLFLKILPLCIETDIIEERDLLSKRSHERTPGQRHDGKAKAGQTKAS